MPSTPRASASLAADWRLLTADKVILLTIIVAAFGYFVDIFDLLLFSILRVDSLKDLGVAPENLLGTGVWLINIQMAGLLLGGFVWGVLGDRIGRIRILFGSILLYSLASIANAFVHSVPQYAALRFICGFGLAGELGLCVTLVSELLPKSVRGLGTALIAGVGVSGAVAGGLLAHVVDWRTAYMIGGALGLCLLFLRMRLRESGIYIRMNDRDGVRRGSLSLLLLSPRRLGRYVSVVMVGAPLWAMVGILMTFTPEFAKDFGMSDMPKAASAIMYCYLGLTIGDLGSGFLSQVLKNRRKSVFLSLCLLSLATAFFLLVRVETAAAYYVVCFVLGLGAGYWAMFVQMGVEQFGTNLRATAATSIPNVVRGLTIPLTASFHALIPAYGVAKSGGIVMAATLLLAFAGLFFIRETFGEDLDYIESGKAAA